MYKVLSGKDLKFLNSLRETWSFVEVSKGPENKVFAKVIQVDCGKISNTTLVFCSVAFFIVLYTSIWAFKIWFMVAFSHYTCD